MRERNLKQRIFVKHAKIRVIQLQYRGQPREVSWLISTRARNSSRGLPPENPAGKETKYVHSQ